MFALAAACAVPADDPDGYWHTWEVGIGAVWPGTASGRLVGNSYGEIDADPLGKGRCQL